MIPFIDGRLLALGPWIVPALILIGMVLVFIAGRMIDRGIAIGSPWHVLTGCLIGLYPVAVMLAGLGIIR